MTALALVVLAAGMGTRMKSATPKVLHKIAGRAMLGHVLHAGKALGAQKAVVIHGPDMAAVRNEAMGVIASCEFAEQTERLGTGHAVAMAKQALAGFKGTVLVLYGDVPLVKADTLKALLSKLDSKRKMAVLGFEAADPHGYGRLITKGKDVLDIREQLDAKPAERKIKLCNSGIIAIDNDLLWALIPKLSNKNAKGEFYLTDLVKLANKAKTKVALALCPEIEVAGVNDRNQLSVLEREFQREARRAAMSQGATLIDPDTVYFSADTKLGQDVVIEPNVFFGPGVSVGDDVEILANSHLEGTSIAKGARIGPFARLRPGAEIGEKVHIGNFVEVKKARIGKGAKANHLSYIGDAIVGAGSNIGAGTITCNYDGYEKHLTDIGENVFVGSNSSLVAPVKIGAGANIAASSVITTDVPEDALAITRAPSKIIDGWAKRYRAARAAAKAAKQKS
ncbi:bifunctional UDP-N-acetylglucosamine diphosphorylase/glucosamine-1-phosphate N-acetyltransferase GlmU [Aestuariivirga litoralis]|uniref:bifunctional UDP-N-acetylglucosamine diphosphorylase/glucosamine-1-phosphate N-acetyltransferase GlmU n=1 Tax=Aestuariivirga litoralis TaxID=2650924 RepID=UPI001AEE9F23|nr:bifunctional UDP-N-acetylglucosamine diphosphorylase/glucosamine-1-phosphate N-acetyltransferase GlmU [Aestuariivirga litoralis]MBG1231420.1 bifunctional UDP-N-acetylglucosamine diphosphorylase/glucosamine-1-phosphate N-acetyltransferase GlmU [Aestuariivirga litoralis]